MRRALLFFCLLLSLSLHAQPTQRDTLTTLMLTPQMMHDDLSYLSRLLRETHPGLYRYQSPAAFNAQIDSVEKLIQQPLSFYQYYKMLAGLISSIRCAHSYVTPVEAVEHFYRSTILTFPLMIFNIQGKYYVTINGTMSPAIKPGDELLKINGRDVADIRKEMRRHLWADGYNEAFKNRMMDEIYFPLFYYTLIERPSSFEVTWRDGNGKERKLVLPAQTLKVTMSNFKKNKVNRGLLSAVKSRNRKERKHGWRMELLEHNQIALIRINAFGGGKTEAEARNRMKTFLDECMSTIHKKHVSNLIIDLRYNGGGWDIQGVELFTYLTRDSARCYHRLHAVTDSSSFLKYSDLSAADRERARNELRHEVDGTFSVQEKYSDQLLKQLTKPNGFRGRVFILANGASGSTTAEFIAYTKSAGLATVVGEETGGAYGGGNGGSFIHLKLPNSRIAVGTPLLWYDNEVKPTQDLGRGTLPDYDVPNVIGDVLIAYDTQLHFVLELIRKQNK